MGDNIEVLFTGFDKVQSLLSNGTTYAIGDEFSIADISVGPWLARIELLLENEFFGKFDKNSVTSVVEVYKSPKYDRLREYNRRVQARPTVKKTYLRVSNNIPCLAWWTIAYVPLHEGRRLSDLPQESISKNIGCGLRTFKGPVVLSVDWR